MSSLVKITRALISVSDKTGIVEFAQKLASHGVQLLSTGGTAKALRDAGLEVQDVSDFTGFPEIMNGRVKTLHPKVHGALLANRADDTHMQAMKDNNIENIDMVVANLYPFVKTVQSGKDFETCIENIDIGGPTMIRAAAKNHSAMTIITDPQDYDMVLADMDANNGAVQAQTRKQLATTAFSLTANYDASISNWMVAHMDKDTNGDFGYPRRISFSGHRKEVLRYGENPHQSAALYTTDAYTRVGVATAEQKQGKALSYNNINDTDAAFELVAEFSEPSVAIIKHANPCGVASANDIATAYDRALLCDPVSAFGGIIALNRALDAQTAEKIIKGFVEVVIAPEINADALEVLNKKSRIRALVTGEMPTPTQARRIIKPVAGGFLVQDMDTGTISEETLKVVTDRTPTQQEMQDMLFAFRVGKHIKSNAIVYAKNGATVGVGAGQMSRIDSARIAAWKAQEAAKKAGVSETLAKGSVVASDAFFPFADGLLAAADAGATAVIQPGGSIRDEEVIKAANERGLAMVLTGQRHFRH